MNITKEKLIEVTNQCIQYVEDECVDYNKHLSDSAFSDRVYDVLCEELEEMGLSEDEIDEAYANVCEAEIDMYTNIR